MDEPQVKSSVVWLKYDFMRAPKLKVGQLAPSCKLHTLNGDAIELSSFFQTSSKWSPLRILTLCRTVGACRWIVYVTSVQSVS